MKFCYQHIKIKKMKNYKMKNILLTIKLLLIAGIFFLSLPACKQTTETATENHEQEEPKEGELTNVEFTNQQFDALEMKVDTLSKHNFSDVVVANGQLEVLPQNKASVTAIIGANITSIKVFEGKKVSKGQVLAYISHPNLLDLQTQYTNAWNNLQYTEKEYQRQKKLYKEKVGSGKDFQKTESEYFSAKALTKSLEAQLKLLNINLEKVKHGEIVEQIPVISPINGYIEKVNVKTGEYAEPQKQLFEIINTKNIHADLMVFEKDIYKVKVGQNVNFTVESVPGEKLSAKIFSVGKTFEKNTKAVLVHAEIENKRGLLIQGMYITGRIATGADYTLAVPEAAIVNIDGKKIIFMAEQKDKTWEFKPIEIKTGQQENGFVEIKLLAPIEKGSLIAMNNAYYLLSEMKKSETGEE